MVVLKMSAHMVKQQFEKRLARIARAREQSLEQIYQQNSEEATENETV